MDVAQWSQQMTSNLQRPMEEVNSPTTPNTNPNNPTNPRGVTQQQALERRTRPQKDQNLGCPRCHSTNTKFCYYNNYSLTQPRYFCKTCRRYWTQGGSLRSVPVGGGSRKNKRSSSSSSILTSPPPPLSQSTTTSLPSMHNKLMIPDLNPPTSLSHLLTSSQNPNIKFLEGHDLNLAFPMQSLFHHHIDHQLPKIEGNNNHPNENHEPPINLNPNNMSTNNSISTKTTTTTTTTSTPFSALELLRTGIASRGNLSPFSHMLMPGSNTLYQSGYPNMQEFKPSMNMFSSPSDHNNMDGSNDHHHHHHLNESNNNNNNNNNNIVESGARLLFPFADMNKLATNTQQHHEDHIDENDQSKGNGNDDHHQHDLNHHHSGYWSGMLGGGTW